MSANKPLLLFFVVAIMLSFVFSVTSAKALTIQDIVNYITSTFVSNPQSTGTQGNVAGGGRNGGEGEGPPEKTTTTSLSCQQQAANCVQGSCSYGGSLQQCTIQNYNNICDNTYTYTTGGCNPAPTTTTTTTTATSQYPTSSTTATTHITTTTTTTKQPCPYDCCNADDPNYQYKACVVVCPTWGCNYTTICQNHQCIHQSTSTTTTTLTTTTTPTPGICKTGTVTATYGISAGSYSIYSDLGSANNWARILIKDNLGNTVETKIINQLDSRDFTAEGLTITVDSVAVLQDGTVVGTVITVRNIGSACPTVLYKGTRTDVPGSWNAFSDWYYTSTTNGSLTCDDVRNALISQLGSSNVAGDCWYGSSTYSVGFNVTDSSTPTLAYNAVIGALNQITATKPGSVSQVDFWTMPKLHDIQVTSFYSTGYPIIENQNFGLAAYLQNDGNYYENVSLSITACPAYVYPIITGQTTSTSSSTQASTSSSTAVPTPPCIVLNTNETSELVLAPGQQTSYAASVSLPQGYYNLTFSAYIPDDATPSNNMMSFLLYVQPQLPTYTIDYKAGWNLFSVPVSYVQSSTSNCIPLTPVYGLYNGVYYQTYYTSGGYGYWIQMQSDCSTNVTGYNISINNFQYLYAGWNIIGAPSESVLFSNILGTCNVTSGPLWFNPMSSSYIPSSTLDPGKGYFLKVSQSCQLGIGLPPPPPQ